MLYQEKGLLISAVFLIDYMYFERSAGASGRDSDSWWSKFIIRTNWNLKWIYWKHFLSEYYWTTIHILLFTFWAQNMYLKWNCYLYFEFGSFWQFFNPTLSLRSQLLFFRDCILSDTSWLTISIYPYMY